MATAEIPWREGGWSFSEIGEPFAEHVRKHLPGYDEVQQLAISAAMWHVSDGGAVLDVGCAAGETLARLRGRTLGRRYEAYGIDVDGAMLREAAERDAEVEWHQTSVLELPDAWKHKFEVVFALFTLQFIPPRQRLDALSKSARALAPAGIMLLGEKIEAKTVAGADLFQGVYSDWKLSRGVSPNEVLAKWASLRGQLQPLPEETYVEWFRFLRLRHELLWAWGPFRLWAITKRIE